MRERGRERHTETLHEKGEKVALSQGNGVKLLRDARRRVITLHPVFGTACLCFILFFVRLKCVLLYSPFFEIFAQCDGPTEITQSSNAVALGIVRSWQQSNVLGKVGSYSERLWLSTTIRLTNSQRA